MFDHFDVETGKVCQTVFDHFDVVFRTARAGSRLKQCDSCRFCSVELAAFMQRGVSIKSEGLGGSGCPVGGGVSNVKPKLTNSMLYNYRSIFKDGYRNYW